MGIVTLAQRYVSSSLRQIDKRNYCSKGGYTDEIRRVANIRRKRTDEFIALRTTQHLIGRSGQGQMTLPNATSSPVSALGLLSSIALSSAPAPDSVAEIRMGAKRTLTNRLHRRRG
jgi:hypothetical protein